MQLQFTDGTTVIVFSYQTVGNLLRRYTPQSPDQEYVTSESSLVDGGEQPVAAYRNVTETAEVAWSGTLSEQRAAMRTLNLLLQQARHRQRTGMGPKVWVEFSPTGAGAYDDDDNYRSEVLSGRVLVDDAYRTGLQVQAEQLLSQVVFTRRYYWEGALTQLPLTNANGTDDLSGLLIYNCQDDGDDYGTRVNYVEIDGVDVEGDLPAPVRLELTNTYADRALRHLWIGHNIWSAPTALNHVLEGEDASGGTEVLSGIASGGAVRRYNLPVADNWYDGWEWTLSSDLLTACAGNYFNLMARFGFGSAGLTEYRFKVLLTQGVVTIWESAPFSVSTDQLTAIRPMLAMRLPSWRPPTGAAAACTLQLSVSRTTLGGENLELDFIHLFATDSYTLLTAAGPALAEDETLIFDSIEDNMYISAAGGATGSFVRHGTLINLQPEADQRLYFLQHANADNVAEVGRTMMVKAYYRPRRLTL